eukprot:c9943_g1_i1.p1 GENE.c9943_g1_i1~~c9943_g1_i1.p1  ORF type:complete len:503 (-),score=137.94 c9943_g1_i1:274-1782(-)
MNHFKLDSRIFWGVGVGVVVVFALYKLFKPCPKGKNIRKPKLDTDYTTVEFEKIIREQAPVTGDQYLVIGTGSLGCRIVDALLARGEQNIRAFDVRRNVHLSEAAEFYKGDITSMDDLLRACDGVDTVYLTAAVIRFHERLPHQAKLSYIVNVQGTQNVIDACFRCGVHRLIQTSSSNVTLARNTGPARLDESAPLVTRQNSPNHYCWTKADSEVLVLAANGVPSIYSSVVLATAVIRPCTMIFGPFDAIGVEPTVKKNMMVLLDSTMHMDFVFVDNIVFAHLLLEKAMRIHQQKKTLKQQQRQAKNNKNNDNTSLDESDDSDDGENEFKVFGNDESKYVKQVLGQAFCITNGEPMTIEDFAMIIKGIRPSIKVVYSPYVFMRLLAHFVELIHRISRSRFSLGELDQLTPASIATCQSVVYSDAKARVLLGYRPLYNVDQAVKKSVDELLRYLEQQQQQQKQQNQQGQNDASESSKNKQKRSVVVGGVVQNQNLDQLQDQQL